MRWVWSYGVWSGWLGLFILLELLGLFRVTPWVTLSETSWHAEDTYPVLYRLLAGFLLGLVLHITVKVGGHGHIALWRAVVFGLVVSFGAGVLRDPALP